MAINGVKPIATAVTHSMSYSTFYFQGTTL